MKSSIPELMFALLNEKVKWEMTEYLKRLCSFFGCNKKTAKQRTNRFLALYKDKGVCAYNLEDVDGFTTKHIRIREDYRKLIDTHNLLVEYYLSIDDKRRDTFPLYNLIVCKLEEIEDENEPNQKSLPDDIASPKCSPEEIAQFERAIELTKEEEKEEQARVETVFQKSPIVAKYDDFYAWNFGKLAREEKYMHDLQFFNPVEFDVARKLRGEFTSEEINSISRHAITEQKRRDEIYLRKKSRRLDALVWKPIDFERACMMFEMDLFWTIDGDAARYCMGRGSPDFYWKHLDYHPNVLTFLESEDASFYYLRLVHRGHPERGSLIKKEKSSFVKKIERGERKQARVEDELKRVEIDATCERIRQKKEEIDEFFLEEKLQRAILKAKIDMNKRIKEHKQLRDDLERLIVCSVAVEAMEMFSPS